MVYRSEQFGEGLQAQGDSRFAVWTYASPDPLEEILKPGYFGISRRISLGDMVIVGVAPPLHDRQHAGDPSLMRRALLIFSAVGNGPTETRLLLDFGTPLGPVAVNDPPAAPAPAKPRARTGAKPTAAAA
jgi:hypothetical protein